MILWIKEKAARFGMDIYWKVQNSKKRKKQLRIAGSLNIKKKFKTINSLQLKAETERGVEFATEDGAVITIDAISASIIRVVCRPEGKLRLDKSWTVSGKNGDIAAEGRDRYDYSIFEKTPFSIETLDDIIYIRTEKIEARVSLNPFHIDWYDLQGNIFSSDSNKNAYSFDTVTTEVRHSICITPEDRLYGFGEKSGLLNKAGRSMLMMNVDVMGYNARKQDPLYKHIPFFISLNSDENAWGIFYDNLSMTEFNAGHSKKNTLSWTADDGDIDYYMIYGPSIKEVVTGYASLTGHMALQPKWSLGYLGSTMTYTESDNAQEELKKFVDLCSEHDVPCDLFHLSSGYTSGPNNKRYVFNWNSEKIPSPEKMVGYFHNGGIKISANIKPCLLTTHPRYNEVKEMNGFIMEKNGKEPHITRFWGGVGSYLDFTNETTRKWWKENIRKHLLDYNIDSAWNDNNEYEIWDNNCRCNGFGTDLAINQIRPIQTLLMTKTSLEAQQENEPEKRPYTICRSGSPGIQRYAQTWTGDNFTSWESLQYNIPMALGLSLSGISNIGHDVGGFWGYKPSPELFLRWVQSGIMNPRFTIHSWHIDETVNEPWMYKDIIPEVREMIRFRYSLIPYLYSIMHHCHENGEAIMRPLIYEFQQDPLCRDISFDYLYGSHLLVAPVYKKGMRKRKVYLPANSDWIDFYSGERYTGGETVTVDAPIDRIPLLVREGGIITMGNSMKFTGADADIYRQILLFPSGNNSKSSFTMVDDDGETVKYKDGFITKTLIMMETSEQSVHVDISVNGEYPLPYKSLDLVLPHNDERELSSNCITMDSTTDSHGRRVLRISLAK